MELMKTTNLVMMNLIINVLLAGCEGGVSSGSKTSGSSSSNSSSRKKQDDNSNVSDSRTGTGSTTIDTGAVDDDNDTDSSASGSRSGTSATSTSNTASTTTTTTTTSLIISTGNFIYGGNYYYSNGMGTFCRYASSGQYKWMNSGSSAAPSRTLTSVDGNTNGGDCQLPAGTFRYAGWTYASKANGHYCYGHGEPFLRNAGTAIDSWPGVEAIPSGMVSDGACVAAIPYGNFLLNGATYFSYGNGQYCYFEQPEHVHIFNNTTSPNVRTWDVILGGNTYMGACSLPSNFYASGGHIYWGHDKQYCWVRGALAGDSFAPINRFPSNYVWKGACD
jgi:hypothetical protein